MIFENMHFGDFPDGPMVKTSPSNAGDVCSIPGQGAKIPYASQPTEKPEHKNNRSKIVTNSIKTLKMVHTKNFF